MGRGSCQSFFYSPCSEPNRFKSPGWPGWNGLGETRNGKRGWWSSYRIRTKPVSLNGVAFARTIPDRPEERQESKANARFGLGGASSCFLFFSCKYSVDWAFSFQWKKMRRQGQYADINPAIAAQMQHMSGQRLQHSSDMSHFPGGSDSFQHGEEHHYMPSKSEEQWQWDRDGTKGSNQLPSQLYKEGRCCLA
ncbi:hypothetical protein MUK42_34555 [Musa troglodytarum]|uniref:Uncharacterized protein n=1 Tax=Musa troglodytarum TaxID=320322 RepID=A0A9E7FIC3_9LILI|nr:hypothetical protein MUK42_34555 [Musa troglodytarum]